MAHRWVAQESCLSGGALVKVAGIHSPSEFVHHVYFGLCRLSYDEGEDEESFEWVDFRELTDDEVRQHPSYIAVQPQPPPPHPPGPSASAAAKPAPKAASSNTEQVSLHCGCLQLRRGFPNCRMLYQICDMV